MFVLELPLLYFLFLRWCRQILASDMTVQYPPAFHLLRGNCPCIIFLCHLSFVFSPMLSLIFLVSLCTSVLRCLAVCYTVESVLCWCVLTTCISGSSFLSTYSTRFVISTAWAASNCARPLPPCCLGTYKRSPSVLDDALHKWLVVSLFSGLVFAVLLGAS